MDEKNLSPQEVTRALEQALERNYVVSDQKGHQRLGEQIQLASAGETTRMEASYRALLINEAQSFANNSWFKECYKGSPKLTRFYQQYNQIKTN